VLFLVNVLNFYDRQTLAAIYVIPALALVRWEAGRRHVEGL
jgi:hypothetical protein